MKLHIISLCIINMIDTYESIYMNRYIWWIYQYISIHIEYTNKENIYFILIYNDKI